VLAILLTVPDRACKSSSVAARLTSLAVAAKPLGSAVGLNFCIGADMMSLVGIPGFCGSHMIVELLAVPYRLPSLLAGSTSLGVVAGHTESFEFPG
jgi:hypothetical protein